MPSRRKPTIRRRRKPSHVAAVPPEYDQLLRLRLENDWSWTYLEQLMFIAGCRLSARTITYMRTRDGRLLKPWTPYDRTLFKIRKFLKLHRGYKRRSTDRTSAA